jgi:hypothetical protein
MKDERKLNMKAPIDKLRMAVLSLLSTFFMADGLNHPHELFKSRFSEGKRADGVFPYYAVAFHQQNEIRHSRIVFAK